MIDRKLPIIIFRVIKHSTTQFPSFSLPFPFASQSPLWHVILVKRFPSIITEKRKGEKKRGAMRKQWRWRSVIIPSSEDDVSGASRQTLNVEDIGRASKDFRYRERPRVKWQRPCAIFARILRGPRYSAGDGRWISNLDTIPSPPEDILRGVPPTSDIDINRAIVVTKVESRRLYVYRGWGTGRCVTFTWKLEGRNVWETFRCVSGISDERDLLQAREDRRKIVRVTSRRWHPRTEILNFKVHCWWIQIRKRKRN